MSLSCDHLVRDPGHVLALSAKVAVRGRLGVRDLLALADAQRIGVIKHVGLCQSSFGAVDVLKRNVCLRKPSPLHINALLRVVSRNEVLAQQVSHNLYLLILIRSLVCASHSHLCSVAKERRARRRVTEMVTVLSREETPFMGTRVRRHQ